MMIPSIMLGVLGVSIGLLMLVSDWRPAFALLVVCGSLLLAFEQRELQVLGRASAGSSIALLNAINIVSTICVGLIVLWTGLTYSRADEPDAADEVGKMQLRRAARHAARASVPQGWEGYGLPVAGVLVLAVGTLLVPLVYPSPTHVGVYAWTLLVLGGILTAATSQTVLKLDMGLLLICFGLRLCYLAEAEAVGLFDLALFSVVPVVVALAMALLSNLLFTRLGTQRLALLFEQTPLASAPNGAAVPPKDTVIANDLH